MNVTLPSNRTRTMLVSGLAAALLSACAMMGMHGPMHLTLSGAQEVPPVRTAAQGSGTITVAADKSVSGSITTTGVAALAAHIHEAAPGKNGPVIIPLTKSGTNVFSVPAGAKLTDSQFAAFKAGDLYVNVHSAAYKDGEIRAQLKP